MKCWWTGKTRKTWRPSQKDVGKGGASSWEKCGLFLDMTIDKKRDLIKIFNSIVVDYITQSFYLSEAKSHTTPMASVIKIDKDFNGLATDVTYQDLIGTLLYFANTVRPDISFTVGRLEMLCYNSLELHWNAAKRVIRYFKRTKTVGLLYPKGDVGILDLSDSVFSGFGKS